MVFHQQTLSTKIKKNFLINWINWKFKNMYPQTKVKSVASKQYTHSQSYKTLIFQQWLNLSVQLSNTDNFIKGVLIAWSLSTIKIKIFLYNLQFNSSLRWHFFSIHVARVVKSGCLIWIFLSDPMPVWLRIYKTVPA